MISRLRNIEVRDSVFDPNLPLFEAIPSHGPGRIIPREVHVRTVQGTTFYKVWIYLDGNDLPFVESVTYVLHRTFPEPYQTVRRTLSNPNCQLVIWTWGVFPIKAIVKDKTGHSREIEHNLSYDRQLREDGIRYVPE